MNERWIFRFVRDLSNTQLAIEQAFLPLFKGHSPLPIPEIRYSGPHFIAYEKIEGVKFSEAIFRSLGTGERSNLAAALGNFLSCFHAVAFEHRDLKAAPFGGGDFWRVLWPAASPRLQSHTRKKAEGYFHRALSRVAAATYGSVVAHSDFGTSNVLLDAARSEIAGVIDFGDMSIGDPAADFATFYRRLGKPFAEAMAEAYRMPLGDDLLNHGFDEHVPGLVSEIESQFAE